MTSSEEQLRRKISLAIRQTMQSKQLRQQDVPGVAHSVLGRALSGRHNLEVSTIVRIFDALGADVDLVITVRKGEMGVK